MMARRIVVSIAAIAAALVALSAPSTGSQSAGSGSECIVPTLDPGSIEPAEGPEAVLPAHAWAAAENSQETIFVVNEVLTETFGSSSKEDPYGPVRAGLIGLALDHVDRRLAVVVDPSYALISELEAALNRAVDDARQAGVNVADLPIDVQAGCNSGSQILDGVDTLHEAIDQERAAFGTYGLEISPFDSRIHVFLGPAARSAGGQLEALLGDLVTVETGTPELREGGRQNDDSPHWGGAGIGSAWDTNPANICTSWFAVTIAAHNGDRGSVTAGHCPHPNHPPNGQNFHSGNFFYGETEGRDDWPQYDMIRLYAPNKSYFPRVYTNPQDAGHRVIVGKRDPVIGEFVCVTGMRTLNVCGVEIVNLTAELCAYPGGQCAVALVKGRKDGELVGQGGDSGAPVYNSLGPGEAGARAMETGGHAFDNFVGERLSFVQNHLDVSVVTNP